MDQSKTGRRSSTSDSGANERSTSQRSAESRMSSSEANRAQRQAEPLQQQQQQQQPQNAGERGFKLGHRYAEMNSDWVHFS
ncbi:hypothetical protein DFQ27_005823 [Actinomortierella ambigua]|uniref:Uncharacterized protein n=1 Tax=Actinomortierella ambigua TaxID=1343610 RepID=A0A9P6QHH4_9FUNG|nr:hypothetical protein DFQ27_005823 [Actinomortierella ambigua]